MRARRGIGSSPASSSSGVRGLRRHRDPSTAGGCALPPVPPLAAARAAAEPSGWCCRRVACRPVGAGVRLLRAGHRDVPVAGGSRSPGGSSPGPVHARQSRARRRRSTRSSAAATRRRRALDRGRAVVGSVTGVFIRRCLRPGRFRSSPPAARGVAARALPPLPPSARARGAAAAGHRHRAARVPPLPLPELPKLPPAAAAVARAAAAGVRRRAGARVVAALRRLETGAGAAGAAHASSASAERAEPQHRGPCSGLRPAPALRPPLASLGRMAASRRGQLA